MQFCSPSLSWFFCFYHDAKVGFILKFHCTLDSIFNASLIPILLYYWFHFHCTHDANFTVLVIPVTSEFQLLQLAQPPTRKSVSSLYWNPKPQIWKEGPSKSLPKSIPSENITSVNLLRNIIHTWKFETKTYSNIVLVQNFHIPICFYIFAKAKGHEYELRRII